MLISLHIFYPQLLGNVVYRPIMKLLTIGNVVKQTTGNVVKHSVQYLICEVEIIHIVMYH